MQVKVFCPTYLLATEYSLANKPLHIASSKVARQSEQTTQLEHQQASKWVSVVSKSCAW